MDIHGSGIYAHLRGEKTNNISPSYRGKSPIYPEGGWSASIYTFHQTVMIPLPKGLRKITVQAHDALSQPMQYTSKGIPLVRLLTSTEVAKLLNVTITTVYRLIERRLLKTHRVAGRLRFHPDDVHAYLENGLAGSHYGGT